MDENSEPTTFLGRFLAGVVVGGIAYGVFSIWSFWGLEGNGKTVIAIMLGLAFFFIGNKLSEWIKNILWWG